MRGTKRQPSTLASWKSLAVRRMTVSHWLQLSAHGYHEVAAVRQLAAQGRRYGRRGGRHHDPVERGMLGEAQAAVAHDKVTFAARTPRGWRRRVGPATRGARWSRPPGRAPPGRRPGSRSRCPPPGRGDVGVSSSSSVIRATMYGWEIVCPRPMAQGFVLVGRPLPVRGHEAVTGYAFNAARTAGRYAAAPELSLDHAVPRGGVGAVVMGGSHAAPPRPVSRAGCGAPGTSVSVAVPPGRRRRAGRPLADTQGAGRV